MGLVLSVVCYLQADIPVRGSTNAGMDWNGMDYWNGLQGSNSQLFFHTLSNRVSIASHTAMSKIVLEGSCVRIVLKLFSSLHPSAVYPCMQSLKRQLQLLLKCSIK